ncbi:MAG: cell division protein ZapE [Alphaproteobacteria bacterium]|nr:cell division protein ZapE [Alphaproteobacteria bacterium]
MAGPLDRYENLVADGVLEADPIQRAAAQRLQKLHLIISSEPPKGSLLDRFRGMKAMRPSPGGIYLWGGVGRGKSLLMDMLFNSSLLTAKRRIHFHAFMAEVHDRVADIRRTDERELRRHPAFDRSAPNDPMPLVAYDVAKTAKLFCFDELQITDIADAMIIGRLLRGMMDRGSVIVATSNRHPDDLYKDGINRQLFEPTIALIKERLDVIRLNAAQDYRLARLQAASTYHSPLGPEADKAMDAAWEQFICGARPREEFVTVKGRSLRVPATARTAARFSFDELCARPLGASDYLAIASTYSTVFLDRIPFLSTEKRNEAKRFVTLVDALYDTRTKLVCSAAGEPDTLYPLGDGSFEFARTASRLVEMRSTDYLAAERRPAVG